MRPESIIDSFEPEASGSKRLVRAFTAAWRRGDIPQCSYIELVAKTEGFDAALATIAEVKQMIPLGHPPDEPTDQATDTE